MTSVRDIAIETAARLGRFIGPALLLGALCACAGVPDAALVDPAKYNYHSCLDLERAMKTDRDRDRQLQALARKTMRDQQGVVIGTLSYGPEFKYLRGDMALIEQVSKRKECSPPVVAQAPAR
jgi:hypothetical protein